KTERVFIIASNRVRTAIVLLPRQVSVGPTTIVKRPSSADNRLSSRTGRQGRLVVADGLCDECEGKSRQSGLKADASRSPRHRCRITMVRRLERQTVPTFARNRGAPGGLPTSSWAWIAAAAQAHEDVGRPLHRRSHEVRFGSLS